MRKIIILISIALAGCGSENDSFGYRAARTTLAVGTLGITELNIAGYERQEGLAKKTCLEAGLKEGTPEYTKCFIEIKKAQFQQSNAQYNYNDNEKATNTSSLLDSNNTTGLIGNNSTYGTPVYKASDCIGANVMGQCHGSVISQPVATCHGTMLNGECIGALMPR